MQPLAIELQLLRTLLLPDVRIAPGRVLMARVATADGTGRGSLSIAGYLLDAELPKHVTAGQDLRLTVRDVTAGRVTLGLTDTAAQAPPPAEVPLPGGGSLKVLEQDAQTACGSKADSQTLVLRYDAPSLGPVDLHFELSTNALRLGVAVSPAALPGAQQASDSLRDGLDAAAEGRAVSVTVTPRREPLEIYA